MKKIIAVTIATLLLTAGCARDESAATSTRLRSEEEKTYPIQGVVRARDSDANALTIEHADIPELMEGMTMSFRVEGADVDELPPNGSGFEGTLHVAGIDYWLSGIRPAPVPASIAEKESEKTDEPSKSAGADEVSGPQSSAGPAPESDTTATARR